MSIQKELDQLAASLEGTLLYDDLHKTLYSTDASVYRIKPKAVAKDHQTKGVAANSARAVLIITPKLAVLGSTPTPT